MPELVPMPKLGFDMAEGTLVRKVKKQGDTVNKGEVLAEIETDKATVEVESPASGVVKGWVVEEGQAVPVGALMAVIGAPDENVDLKALQPASQGPLAGAPASAAPSPARPKGANGHQEANAPATVTPAPAPAAPAAAPIPSAPSGPAAPASPIARKMAADAGVDISQITGTGPGGRITKKDVESYLAHPPAAMAASAEPAPAPVAAPAPAPVATLSLAAREDQTVPLSRMRQAIARRMTESTTTAPQFYVTSEVDMDAAMKLRGQINALLPEAGKVSVNDLIIKATALALREFPNLNASFAGDAIVRKGHVNIGNAVALDNGLLTVVVRDADQKPLALIAAEMKAMVARVRAGKVQTADIEGSTFSISNLGKWDVNNFIAIINPPEAAILATGTVKPVPVIKNGAVAASQRMLVSITADHRVTDGAEAAAFLQAVKQKLEQPLRLML
jgi:pyruvate dehydrogenase E2 component (dihydrolipoyllysine-residue acetyltransferase)